MSTLPQPSMARFWSPWRGRPLAWSRKPQPPFSSHAAVSSDGWHLRHYSWIPREAIELVIDMFMVAEARGIFPRQLRLLQIFLVEKPKGGFRSLGLFPSLYRLWGRVRRIFARKWEIFHSRKYIIFGPGGSAVEAVWRQTILAEEAAHLGHHSASLLWDLREYYEHVDRGKLQDRGKALDFPRPLARTSCQMYAASRVVTFSGSAAHVGFAVRGVVAGCTMATVHIQFYSMDALDTFSVRHPTVILQVYIDDYLLQCCHRSARYMLECLIEAARALIKVIEDELLCTIHIGKADAVASSGPVLEQLRRMLGPLKGLGQVILSTSAYRSPQARSGVPFGTSPSSISGELIAARGCKGFSG